MRPCVITWATTPGDMLETLSAAVAASEPACGAGTVRALRGVAGCPGQGPRRWWAEASPPPSSMNVAHAALREFSLILTGGWRFRCFFRMTSGGNREGEGDLGVATRSRRF